MLHRARPRLYELGDWKNLDDVIFILAVLHTATITQVKAISCEHFHLSCRKVFFCFHVYLKGIVHSSVKIQSMYSPLCFKATCFFIIILMREILPYNRSRRPHKKRWEKWTAHKSANKQGQNRHVWMKCSLLYPTVNKTSAEKNWERSL